MWLRGSTYKILFEISLTADSDGDFDIEGYMAETFPKYKKVANALNTLDDYNDIAGEADCFFERGSISEYDYSSLACSYADGKLILRFYGDDIR